MQIDFSSWEMTKIKNILDFNHGVGARSGGKSYVE